MAEDLEIVHQLIALRLATCFLPCFTAKPLQYCAAPWSLDFPALKWKNSPVFEMANRCEAFFWSRFDLKRSLAGCSDVRRIESQQGFWDILRQNVIIPYHGKANFCYFNSFFDTWLSSSLLLHIGNPLKGSKRTIGLEKKQATRHPRRTTSSLKHGMWQLGLVKERNRQFTP